MSAALKLPPPPVHMTVEEFLVWDSGDTSGARWQLRNGVPEMMAPPYEGHGAIQNEIAHRITAHLRGSGSRCRVVTTPGVIPRLYSSRNMLIPDIGITCAPPSGGHPMPDPLVLIEVLSESNQDETLRNLHPYATIPSMREIVLVRSWEIVADVYRLGTDGTWPVDADRAGADDLLRIEAIDFAMPLREAYRTTTLALPDA